MLPGAAIVVRNTGTAATWEQTSDAAGRYQVLLLPPGEYEVHFSLQGFRPLELPSPDCIFVLRLYSSPSFAPEPIRLASPGPSPAEE